MQPSFIPLLHAVGEALAAAGSAAIVIPEPDAAPAYELTEWDKLFDRSAVPLLMRHSGVPATYTPPYGATVPLRAVLGDEVIDEVEDEAGRRVKARWRYATIGRDPAKSYGGVAEVQLRGSMGVRGEEWGIAEVLPAGALLWRLKLVRREVLEVGRRGRYVR